MYYFKINILSNFETKMAAFTSELCTENKPCVHSES